MSKLRQMDGVILVEPDGCEDAVEFVLEPDEDEEDCA